MADSLILPSHGNVSGQLYQRAAAVTRLLLMLPSFYSPVSTTAVLLGGVGPELDMVWEAIDEIPLQTYVDYATWGIDQLELTVGITPDDSVTLSARQDAVRAIKVPAGPVTLVSVEAFLKRFPYGAVDITYLSGKTLTLTFQDQRGVPPSLDQIYAGLDALLPAWISYVLDFQYTTHAELKSWGVTLAQLKALQLTHAQLKTWAPSGPISAASQSGNLSLTFVNQAQVIAESGNLALTFVQPNITVVPGG